MVNVLKKEEEGLESHFILLAHSWFGEVKNAPFHHHSVSYIQLHTVTTETCYKHDNNTFFYQLFSYIRVFYLTNSREPFFMSNSQ